MKKQSDHSLEKIFREMPEEIKLGFLRKALEKNETLRNQFTLYYDELKQKPTHPLPADPEKIIADTCTNLQNELESLDFDNIDWREYVPRHSGYIEDYEAWEEYAGDQLCGVFQCWLEVILHRLETGELTTGICQVMGCYIACFDVDIPGSENIFDDMTGELLVHHQELMNAVVDILEKVTVSEAEIHATITAILDQSNVLRDERSDFLNYLEPILLMITETAGTARFITEQMGLRDLDESLVPQLALRIASFNPDPLIWYEKAVEYMDLDLNIAIQLMDYYWKADPVCFRKVGRKLFSEDQDTWCDYFRALLYPLFDEPFYVDVLRYLTLREREIDLYGELRNYLSEEEKDRFLDEIDWDEKFVIEVLAMEKRHEDLLRLATKQVLTTWNFTRMITPLLPVYPHETLNLIRKKCEDTISHHKNRENYQRICQWLRLALSNPRLEEKTGNLVRDLYNRKPALPALREELRKAGVVGK